jgi:hypothetical protein
MLFKSLIRNFIVLLFLSLGLKAGAITITPTLMDKTTFIKTKVHNYNDIKYNTGKHECVKFLKEKKRNKKGVAAFVPKINDPAFTHQRSYTYSSVRTYNSSFVSFLLSCLSRRGPPIA